MGRVTHYDTVQMMAGLLAKREEPYFTVTVHSDTAPFNYSFTPYVTSGESFWVDWGDGSEEILTTVSSVEKTHEYANSGTYTIKMLGSAGINRVRISPTDAGQAALVIGSNGNLDKLGTLTVTTEMFRECANLAMTELTGGITSIGERTFQNCANITLTSLPVGITTIGNYAFSGCTNITLTSLPEGITTIGNYAFYNCTNLALTSLPAGITSIDNSTFRYCTNLALTSLPAGITSIGNDAFRDCAFIDDLVFLGTPTSIASNAFTASGANLFVPWSEGALADAPWGAASVTYDYTP